jgi:hypothetical protein
MHTFKFAVRLRLSLVLGCVLSGCARDDRPACHPVRGTVTLADKPVAEATVVFHPTKPLAGHSLKPIAYTDAQGNFELTTFTSGDGAPAGDYAITVVLREPKQVGEELVRDGKHLLPFRYSDPQKSGLSFTVKAEANVVPALKLSAR